MRDNRNDRAIGRNYYTQKRRRGVNRCSQPSP